MAITQKVSKQPYSFEASKLYVLLQSSYFFDRNTIYESRGLLLNRVHAWAKDYVRVHGELPVRWASIEVMTEGRYSTASDVWAYGVLTYEVMSRGQTPYHEKKNLMEVAEYIKAGKVLDCPERCPDSVYQRLMIPCWNAVASSRPTFVELHETALSLGGHAGETVQGSDAQISSSMSKSITRKSTMWAQDLVPDYWKTPEGRKLLGVSVHHLTRKFKEKTMNAIQSPAFFYSENSCKLEDATVWHAVTAYAKPKGEKIECPRDGELGCAYVDTLEGDDHFGPANAFLSYTWCKCCFMLTGRTIF